MTDGADILTIRERTHGEAARTAQIQTEMTWAIRQYWAGQKANPVQAMAINMICLKLARISSGDANHADHWRDIAGYAQLVLRELE